MKIGILGGGQLGKMLSGPAHKLDKEIHFMDQSMGPVSKISKNYTSGDIGSFNDVMEFSRELDVLSIEIEKVNTKALAALEHAGTKVYPQPHIVELIQDKGDQKAFYVENDLPSSRFKCYANLDELKVDIESGIWTYPFVQKLRRDGYDGRGVQVIRSEKELESGFTKPFLVEEMVDIKKELGVVTCSDQNGNIVIYDPVEMVFHSEANILLYQLAPARIDPKISQKAIDLARSTAEKYGIVGLLAIELFYTSDGEILINEVAPRPHNSGHHTIEATFCSQYENQIRVLSNLPMGSTQTHSVSLLMNLLGAEGYEGDVYYEGIEKVLSIPGVHVHIYGKQKTKPFRKMGHITVVDNNYTSLIEKYESINQHLKVISK